MAAAGPGRAPFKSLRVANSEVLASTPEGAYRQAAGDAYPGTVAQTEPLIVCANCGRPVREADADALGWRFYSDGVGELLPFCGLCAHREFRPDAAASTDA